MNEIDIGDKVAVKGEEYVYLGHAAIALFPQYRTPVWVRRKGLGTALIVKFLRWHWRVSTQLYQWDVRRGLNVETLGSLTGLFWVAQKRISQQGIVVEIS